MQDYRSINPATGELLASYALHGPNAIEAAVIAADAAFQVWRRTEWKHRSAALIRLATQLRNHQTEFARLMATEMGKPLADGAGEIEKCALLCEYYARHGEALLRDEEIASDAARSFVSYQPLGVLFAIMPWNFPFWQVLRAVVPAIMAGNSVLLKHAPNVGGCAVAIESAFHAADFPPGLFTNLFLDNPGAGALIEHRLVRAVTFTGSTRAGRMIARRAGQALKPAVLELGGSDPYLILADADLDEAARICVQSRLINGGQSCIAAKRFIAVAEVYEPFLARVVQHMRAAVSGDPFQNQTTLGPLARLDLRETLHRQVETSVGSGAELLLGGVLPPASAAGAYYPPTVLARVTPNMPAGSEELFGPVAAVLCANDESHAIALANNSPFGLGAAIFSKNAVRAERLAAESLEAGSVFINEFVKSDPHLPFGGIKDSGYGRELGTPGLRAFTNAKTIRRA